MFTAQFLGWSDDGPATFDDPYLAKLQTMEAERQKSGTEIKKVSLKATTPVTKQTPAKTLTGVQTHFSKNQPNFNVFCFKTIKIEPIWTISSKLN